MDERKRTDLKTAAKIPGDERKNIHIEFKAMTLMLIEHVKNNSVDPELINAIRNNVALITNIEHGNI